MENVINGEAVSAVTKAVLDSNCETSDQIIQFIWSGILDGIKSDPENNTPFKFYTENNIGFGLYPLYLGYMLHLKCKDNGELIVILTHEHLEYEVDAIHNAVKHYQVLHFSSQYLMTPEFFGEKEWNEMVYHDLTNYILWGHDRYLEMKKERGEQNEF